MPINFQQARAAIEQAAQERAVQGMPTARFASPSVEHVSLGRGLRVVILLVLWAAGSVVSLLLGLGAGGLPTTG